MVIIAKRVAHVAEVSGVVDPDGNQAVYAVTGELLFASSNDQPDRQAAPDHQATDRGLAALPELGARVPDTLLGLTGRDRPSMQGQSRSQWSKPT